MFKSSISTRVAFVVVSPSFNRFNLFLLLLFVSLSVTRAQLYTGEDSYIFLENQPNARSEAVGRSGASLTGSPFFSFYNPASSSFLNGVSTDISYLNLRNPLYSMDFKYTSIAAGANMGKYGAFCVGLLRSVWGKEFQIYTSSGNTLKVTPAANIYMLNYSYQFQNNFSAGFNLNYYEENFEVIHPKGFLLDAGLMKIFQFNSAAADHNISFGLSFTNLLNKKVYDDQYIQAYLPSIMRFGTTYEYHPINKVSDFNLLGILLSAEYFDLLNSKLYTQYRLGSEVTLLEILKLRGGWYTKKISDANIFNLERISQATYGLGLEIPFSHLSSFNLPVKISFDYTSLPAPDYGFNSSTDKHSPVYSLSINYSGF